MEALRDRYRRVVASMTNRRTTRRQARSRGWRRPVSSRVKCLFRTGEFVRQGGGTVAVVLVNDGEMPRDPDARGQRIRREPLWKGSSSSSDRACHHSESLAKAGEKSCVSRSKSCCTRFVVPCTSSAHRSTHPRLALCVQFGGAELLVADLRDIIRSKEASDRPQDRAVLRYSGRHSMSAERRKRRSALPSHRPRFARKATAPSSARACHSAARRSDVARYISSLPTPTAEMKRDRSQMTVRIVPLTSDEAGDARVNGTPDQRLALTSQLSISAWTNTGRPFPQYQRSEMPVRVTRLGAEHGRD